MTWEGAVGAPERLDELKTMYEDGHEHRSLQLDLCDRETASTSDVERLLLEPTYPSRCWGA